MRTKEWLLVRMYIHTIQQFIPLFNEKSLSAHVSHLYENEEGNSS